MVLNIRILFLLFQFHFLRLLLQNVITSTPPNEIIYCPIYCVLFYMLGCLALILIFGHSYYTCIFIYLYNLIKPLMILPKLLIAYLKPISSISSGPKLSFFSPMYGIISWINISHILFAKQVFHC